MSRAGWRVQVVEPVTVPTYVLTFEPQGDGALAASTPSSGGTGSVFTVRLDVRNGAFAAVTIATSALDDPCRLPAGWADACQEARRTPADPPPAFLKLWFDLWQALPEPIRAALTPILRQPARLVICAHGDAAAVPWEMLAVEVPVPAVNGTEKVPVVPGLCRHWHVMRRPPGVQRAAVPTHPTRRALLLVGSLAAPANAVDPHQYVARIALAMRLAGFEVTVAAGRRLDTVAMPQGIDVNQWLDEPGRVTSLLRTGGFTLFHYVGHSYEPGASDQVTAIEAATAVDPQPLGAEDLLLEVRGAPLRLPAPDLAGALLAGGVRCAVFGACDLRQLFADALLAAGAKADARTVALEHVLTMGARVPVAVCAEWSQGFYESLRDQPSVAAAASAGAARLHTSDLGRRYAWLPQHWSSTDVDLTFADDERVLIERVCRRVVAQLDTFEGRFRRRLDPATLADVYVDLFIDPRCDEAKVRAAGETLDERDTLPADPLFQDLLRLAHTRRILLTGPPGAGKSTTLRICARQLADNPLRPCVPLFVRLVDWLPRPTGDGPRYEHLLDYLARVLATGADEPERLLHALRQRGSNELAFLLDGLDELAPSARAFLDQELAAVRTDFAASRFVVSSRRYEHGVRVPGFVPFDIRPLRPKRAADLLVKVLRTNARTRDGAEEMVRRDWLPRFDHGPRTWLDLGKVPLFVTLIGELLIHGRQPGSSRVAFFAEVFDHLCLDQHKGGDVDPGRAGVGVRPLIATPRGDKRDPRALRARVDAVLDVLAFLAHRMTLDCRLTATRSELLTWLEDGREWVTANLTLADVETDDDVTGSDPTAFLHAVARRTLILAPDVEGDNDASDDAQVSWQFWHRSFQEALTARRLLALLDAGSKPTDVVANMRLEPSDAETEAARLALLERYRVDEDAFWNDFNEFYVKATADEARRLLAHQDPDDSFRPTVTLELAALTCREAAKRALFDFWIEPASLLLAQLVERKAEARRDVAASLLRALEQRDASLARAVAGSLDRCPPALLAHALDATSRGDKDVSKAANGTELYEGLTLRLSERTSLYRTAAAATIDPEALAILLLQRARMSDDTGELFLIDEALAALGPLDAAKSARMELRGRFGRPSAALYADYFVRLPGGTFDRGSAEGQAREQPMRRVELSPFAIGRTAVTVAMFREFFPAHRMAVGKGIVRLDTWHGDVEGERVDAFPVTYVSWWAAQMFGRWLSWHREVVAPGFPEAWQPGLPTEAEREFAARGGGSTAYWFGSDESALDEHGWSLKNSGERAHAVALKRQNPFGLFDVHGGVWEWCLDAYGPYQPGVEVLKDPLAGGASASARVLRGGSFSDVPVFCRSAYRSWGHPANADWDLGFRVVLAARPQLGSAIDDRS